MLFYKIIIIIHGYSTAVEFWRSHLEHVFHCWKCHSTSFSEGMDNYYDKLDAVAISLEHDIIIPDCIGQRAVRVE